MYIHTHRAGRIFRSLLVRFCDRFSQFQKHKNHLKPFPWWPWLPMALVSNHPYIWRRFRTKESSSLTLAAAFFCHSSWHHQLPWKTVPFILLQLLACFIIQLPTSQLTWSSHIFLALSFTLPQSTGWLRDPWQPVQPKKWNQWEITSIIWYYLSFQWVLWLLAISRYYFTNHLATESLCLALPVQSPGPKIFQQSWEPQANMFRTPGSIIGTLDQRDGFPCWKNGPMENVQETSGNQVFAYTNPLNWRSMRPKESNQ